MKHVEHRHEITVSMPVDRAILLFTPLGERDWVGGWEPEFLHPADGETGVGMVFRTRHGGEETLWSCIDWSPGEHRVRYVRVTPGSRFGHVEVTCREAGAGTVVSVCYALTALSTEGETLLADLDLARFREMIESWRTAIERRFPVVVA